MGTILSMKQRSLLETGLALQKVTSSGTQLVFIGTLVRAVIKFILSLFMKKPSHVKLKA